jgi:uncharacterized protein (TIGR03437 family)
MLLQSKYERFGIGMLICPRKFFNRLSVLALGAIACGACWADESGTLTLRPNASFSFEQAAPSAEPDIFWNGISLEPRSGATLFNLGPSSERTYRLITAKHAARVSYSAEPIPVTSLAPGDVFGVRTRAGAYAKVQVKSSENGMLSLSYTSFGREKPVAAAPAPKANAVPFISSILNNYSYILPGQPNYGIAPGSIFVIFGSSLSTSDPPVLQSSASPGLPTALNQTSVSVTVNGVKTTPGIYYTSATAVAAVLPSNTPVGLGSVTVTYNGTSSLSSTIQVVASAPGLDTLYGTGNGAGVATDANGNVIGLTNSAKPGQTIILWGSGIGGDTNNDDRIFPQKQLNQTSLSPKVFIGGIAANILYAGRSQFPGLDQYNVVVPPNVGLGCFVSAVMTVGADASSTLVSNTVMLPISANGGACTDPATGLSGATIQTVGNKPGGTARSLLLSIEQDTDSNGNFTQGSLGVIAGSGSGNVLPQGYEYASQGSCTIVPPRQAKLSGAGFVNPGPIQVTGPLGAINITGSKTQLPVGTIPSGTYTFSGAGGATYGAFKASIDYEPPVTVTNSAALSTMTRASGVTVTWSGGPAIADVQVSAFSGGPNGFTRIYCHAPASAGQFTIPPSILLALSPGPGGVQVSTLKVAPFTVSGADLGFVTTASSTTIRNVVR